MDAKVFPQGVANYDPNSWSKVAGNNSLHLIEKSSLFETGSVAPCSTCTKMTKLITTEAKLQRASKYHSPCCIPSLPLHTLARHTRRARQFPRWPWVKLTETCELAPHNLLSSYDHLMIILWSSYDHLMIILNMCPINRPPDLPPDGRIQLQVEGIGRTVLVPSYESNTSTFSDNMNIQNGAAFMGLSWFIMVQCYCTTGEPGRIAIKIANLYMFFVVQPLRPAKVFKLIHKIRSFSMVSLEKWDSSTAAHLCRKYMW